ncbi:hypothetical protein ACIQAL_28485 [Pseudomonas sp. NPDC088368]|jgi:hypothetical protein|uniref:hypothetical protein n=1 Tax=Pseudomonas sp. NPDC088368 TaxID=3364453 RepID=UPI003808DF60
MNTGNVAPEIIITRSSVEPIPLPAPDIAVAFHDDDNLGLIPVSELNAPLTVDLEVWPAAEPGYTYQLYWDGQGLGPVKVISTTDKPGDPLKLEIPVEALTEGYHSLAYRIYSPVGESEDFSAVFPVIIDRTAPGKPVLAPILFPVEVQNGLTAAELAALGSRLEVSIPGYTGMTKHDLITTYWGDIKGPTATVDETDMGLNKVAFEFTKPFLETISSGSHPVKYQVTDRAGNISDDSLAVDVLLLLEEIPDNYPAPILDPAIGTLIDYLEAKPGIRVDIPRYVGASAFDQITLYWGTNSPMLPVQLPPGSENDDIVLSLRVPYEKIAEAPIGAISITYRVMRNNQLNGSSLPTQVDVHIALPIPEVVSALTVQGTSSDGSNTEDNFIDENDYELNAQAIVKWNGAFQISDEVHLRWGDQERLHWYQVRSTDIANAKDLIIGIDNAVMRAQGTGAEIPVRYSVTRLGNPNATVSPVQKVIVRSTEDLPGGLAGIDGPAFKLNASGAISHSVAPNGTDGHVAPYVNIKIGQKLFFSFRGFDRQNNPIEAADFTDTRILDDRDITDGYDFHVPHTILRTVCTGFIEAYVRVEPAPGSNQSSVTSKATRLTIEMRLPSEGACSI